MGNWELGNKYTEIRIPGFTRPPGSPLFFYLKKWCPEDTDNLDYTDINITGFTGSPGSSGSPRSSSQFPLP